MFTAYTQQSSFVEGKFVYNQIEAYLQDNWKVNSNLTLDYGLRFTHQVPQYDANGQASNFFLDQLRSLRPLRPSTCRDARAACFRARRRVRR